MAYEKGGEYIRENYIQEVKGCLWRGDGQLDSNLRELIQERTGRNKTPFQTRNAVLWKSGTTTDNVISELSRWFCNDIMFLVFTISPFLI